MRLNIATDYMFEKDLDVIKMVVEDSANLDIGSGSVGEDKG